MRTGYTTGTCAAAAAKAAALAWFRGLACSEIEVELPAGGRAVIPVEEVRGGPDWAEAAVRKDAGDDPDVTHGLLIKARVEPLDLGIVLRGGPGVGTITRPGLALTVGEPAINPVPRLMIINSVRQALPPGSGATVTISVPRGEEVARRTMNPRLGIVGGISILGTTGIVRPMSNQAWKDSLVLQLDQAAAAGHRHLILTPGKIGENASRLIFGAPIEAVAQMSNFVGFMLKECADRGFGGVILSGHHGKLVKVAAGVFETHSRLADARRETIAAHAAALGAPPVIVEALLEANTAEACLDVLDSIGFTAKVFLRLAERVSRRAEEYLSVQVPGLRLSVGSALLDLGGRALAIESRASEIARKAGWKYRD